MPVPSNHQCPECGGALPPLDGYTTWCQQCHWNLQPPKIEVQNTLINRLHLRFGNRLSKQLFDELLSSPDLRRSFSWSVGMAYILAGITHAVTVAFLVGGIILLWVGWPNFWIILGGLIAIAIAFVTRPRIPKLPDDLIPRAELPALYGLIDDICARLGHKPIKGVRIDHSFNASYLVAGWGRHSIITIGLPLFSVLQPNEKVALLGHEIGHGVNGDNSRGMLIGSAIDSLDTWYGLVMPAGVFSSESGMPGIIMAPMNLLLMGIGGIIYSIMYSMLLLLFRRMQRAEYLADDLAADAAGTEAELGSEQKLYFGDTYWFAAQRVALEASNLNFIDELHLQMQSIPDHEIERIQRVATMENSRLDATHPPTPLRFQFIASRPYRQPTVSITEQQAAAIEVELQPYRELVHGWMINQYRNMIYD